MKKATILLLCVSFIVSMAGCGQSKSTSNASNSSSSMNSSTSVTAASQKTISGFFDKLKSSGSNLAGGTQMDGSYLGASSGYKYTVDGAKTEVYQFNTKNLSSSGSQYYTQAKNGTITLFGQTVKADQSGDFVILLDNGDSATQSKIDNAFKAYFG